MSPLNFNILLILLNFLRMSVLKETRNSFKKWPLNLGWIPNKAIMEVGNITKAATFKSFYWNTVNDKSILASILGIRILNW